MDFLIGTALRWGFRARGFVIRFLHEKHSPKPTNNVVDQGHPESVKGSPGLWPWHCRLNIKDGTLWTIFRIKEGFYLGPLSYDALPKVLTYETHVLRAFLTDGQRGHPFSKPRFSPSSVFFWASAVLTRKPFRNVLYPGGRF